MKPSRNRAPIGWGTGSVTSGSTLLEMSGFCAAHDVRRRLRARDGRRREQAGERHKEGEAAQGGARNHNTRESPLPLGFPPLYALLRVREPPDPRARGHPRRRRRLRDQRRGRQADRGRHRRAGGDQVAGAHRRPDEGGRRQVRRHAGGVRGARQGDPRARDQRPHAPRRARRREGRRSPRSTTPGVIYDGIAQEANVRLLGHGRHRHRGGRGDSTPTTSGAATSRRSCPAWTSSPRT